MKCIHSSISNVVDTETIDAFKKEWEDMEK